MAPSSECLSLQCLKLVCCQVLPLAATCRIARRSPRWTRFARSPNVSDGALAKLPICLYCTKGHRADRDSASKRFLRAMSIGDVEPFDKNRGDIACFVLHRLEDEIQIARFLGTAPRLTAARTRLGSRQDPLPRELSIRTDHLQVLSVWSTMINPVP